MAQQTTPEQKQPKQRRIDGQQYTRSLPVECRVVDEESRRVELSFSSEQPVRRWFGQEILCHDEGSVNLSRLTEVGALLFAHGRDPNLGNLPVGRIVEARLDGESRRGKAVVEFDADERSELIYQKVLAGSLRGVSAGYSLDQVEEVRKGKASKNGRFQGPCVIGTRWTPFEISIEPTPADPSVGVGRSMNDDTNYSKGDESMNEENTNTQTTQEPETRAQQPAPAAPAAPPAVPSPDPAQTRAEAAQAERTRVSEISAMCRDFGVAADEYISGGQSQDQVRSAILEKIKTGEIGQRAIPAANLEVTADEEDKYRAAARDGLMLRMGFPVEKPVEGAADFRGLSLRSLAQKCLARSAGGALDVMDLDDKDLLRAALGFDERSGTLQPNAAFVSIVNNTVGAVLSQGYATANTTFESWTGTGSNPNFKTAKRFRLSAAGEMVEVQQNGEFKADTTKDEGVDTQLKTFGKKFGFTRQAFIDDDLGTLAKSIQAQVRSAKRTINRMVYELLGKNASYSLDKKALFHADHKNLGAAGSLGVDTLGELYRIMSLQKDLSGKEQLNIMPKFGLFPVALAMDARRLLNSLADPEANHAGVINPVQGLVTPIFDAELDKYSSTAFYAVADAKDVDTIEVGYLNGKKEPTLESRPSWDTLGIEYRMYHDWYVAALDFRGLAMNAGK